ncbi:UvrD-helicase domain-containing protein [Cytophaga sp. FL35]|uniref:UvrD-helicase domain-containing protein n=1 Tax=Cytophaga sp. FL35 TaxID=1904456 RepID=UPI001CA3D450|nr:UvrD-helicase domain-containing protein [Cytophaga sp. FL35]
MLRTLLESLFCVKKHLEDIPYKIYNASAGSGKTYTLTKEYLKIVLGSKGGYRKILAITFTNKAVNEMKSRILRSLEDFATNGSQGSSANLFKEVQAELSTTEEELKNRSAVTLKEILHNYAFFDISTIDKFTHRIIRTFAKDLGIPQNFEVVLETDLLLDEAVGKLLQRAGTDEKITKVLLDFALEKIDDDKSWDISQDLFNIGKLIFNENHSGHLEKLKNKSIDDFLELKSELRRNQKLLEEKLISTAKNILSLIDKTGLEFSDFTRGYFPKFIEGIANGNLNLNFDAGWKQNFESTALYNKSAPENIKATLDDLHPTFSKGFLGVKKYYYQLQFSKNIYGNVVPLTVLNSIRKEVKALQKDRDLLLISEFNELISKEIKNQPAPFIYERLGEKYRHYFIDEFQDTSLSQWGNLIPLMGNAMESMDAQGKSGSIFLVGDAKQAIYRWRGGRAEQFLNLVGLRTNPFVIEPSTYNLPVNYRSHEEVINFNNDFFTITSPFLNNQLYRALFEEGNKQKTNFKKGGHVNISFIEEEEGFLKEEVFGKEVINRIGEITDKGYSLHDICILVRSNRHGVFLADFLTQNDIPTISSESLLLVSSDKVRFLVNLLRFAIDPQNSEVAYELVKFLGSREDKGHSYLYANLDKVEGLFVDGYDFDIKKLSRISVYDGVEWAIKQFKLAESSDAYLSFFLDEVFDIEKKEGTGIYSFLDNWEKRKERLSVTAPENLDAVRIMTVHKSKGLEFPFVIFPFANEHIYKRIGGKKMWLPVASDFVKGFEEVLVNEKKELTEYGQDAEDLYHQEEHLMELDSFNVLYVALTRAEKGLYIISELDLDKSGQEKPEYYSGLFIHFLKSKNLWSESKRHYDLGFLDMNTREPTISRENHVDFAYTFKERDAFKILTQSGSLWDTEVEEARAKGNQIHHVLGLIETKDDIESALKKSIATGVVNQDEVSRIEQELLAVMQHPSLQPYYSKGKVYMNEKDVITSTGTILRPDRVVIEGKKAVLIDYKTGKRNPKYTEQIYSYADALQEMGLEVTHKILVYINDTVKPEFV